MFSGDTMLRWHGHLRQQTTEDVSRELTNDQALPFYTPTEVATFCLFIEPLRRGAARRPALGAPWSCLSTRICLRLGALPGVPWRPARRDGAGRLHPLNSDWRIPQRSSWGQRTGKTSTPRHTCCKTASCSAPCHGECSMAYTLQTGAAVSPVSRSPAPCSCKFAMHRRDRGGGQGNSPKGGGRSGR